MTGHTTMPHAKFMHQKVKTGLLVVLAVVFTGCDAGMDSVEQVRSDGLVSTRVVAQIDLPLVDTVVVPTFSPTTAWFQRPRSLQASADADFFWAIDPHSSVLTKLSSRGNPVRSLGVAGEGPGQLQAPKSLVEDGSSVFVLDFASQKIVAFDETGAAESTTSVSPQVWDLALTNSGELAVVPGKDHLVDVYVGGRVVRNMGPQRGDSILCRFCEIATLPDGRLLVTHPPTSRLFLLDGETGSWAVVDLRNSTLKAWRSALESSKDWVGGIVSTSNTHALLLMHPPHSKPDGNEVWKIDLQTGKIVRHPFSGEGVVSAVEENGDVFALLYGAQGILKFTIPRGGTS